MTLTGSLPDFPLPDVLGFLAASKKSGALRVDTDGRSGTIYLHQGSVYLAESTDVPTVEEALADAGLVDAEAMAAARERSVGGLPALAAPQSDVVAEIEALSVESFVGIVAEHDGSFRFDSDERHWLGTVSVSSAERYVAAVRQRRTEIRAGDAAGQRFRMTPTLPESTDAVTLDARDWQLLAAMIEGGSTTTMAESLGRTPYGVGRALRLLQARGLVVGASGAALAAPSGPSDPTVAVPARPSRTSALTTLLGS